MAKLYEKLQKALTSYEDRPEGIITEQTSAEGLYIIRGKDQGISAWHYILVPATKVAHLKAHPSGTTIDITKFGHVVEYRNKRGKIIPTSGWGTDPPKMFEIWIVEHYGVAALDEKTNLTYEEDDIRLCTMQRSIPQQKLGVSFYYHQHERFHYIKLTEDLPSSLAHRAGLKNYDRIITLNDVNIENYIFDQLWELFNTERHFPVQMLVCSPVTHAYYKDNKKLLHSDLSTVQWLKPVYATATSDSNTDTPEIFVDEKCFCAVQWKKSGIVSIMPQSAIYKSPEFTCVNDMCFVETEGQYRKGKIICIGSYGDCEKLKAIPVKQMHDSTSTGLTSASQADIVDTLSFENSCQKLGTNTAQIGVTIQKTNDITNMAQINNPIQYIQERPLTTFEQFPNELFFYLFTYLDMPNLYNAFWGLNSRLNNLFQSYENLCLTFDEKTDQLSMKLYAPHVIRLIIDTSINCDFSQFPALQTLILCDGNSEHLKQIQPEIVPNLTHLSFLLGSSFTPSSQLVCDVFSNKFPSLYHANLGRINNLTTSVWSTSPSLRFVLIRSNKPMLIRAILASCPSLNHLQLHVLNKDRSDVILPSSSNHPLRRFTLWSHSLELTLNDIDTLVTCTPNVQHFYLQTVCDMPFIDLVNGLVNRLHYLSRFDCHVKEMINSGDRVNNLTTVHQLHPCFNRIKCIEENEDFRIFATE